jgi:hypothetical protein
VFAYDELMRREYAGTPAALPPETDAPLRHRHPDWVAPTGRCMPVRVRDPESRQSARVTDESGR